MAVTEVWEGDDFIDALKAGTRAAMYEIGRTWLDAWHEEWDPEKHPYMTGRSRDEGEAFVTENGNTIGVLFTSSPDYLVFEELGTDHQPAHHPMLNSVDAVSDSIIPELVGALDQSGIPAAAARVNVTGGVSTTRWGV